MPCGACGCACSEAPSREELEAPLLMDIETGGLGHITPAPPPDGEVDEPTDAEMDKPELIFCCIARGVLALLWLYLVDLMRRTIPDDDDDDDHQYQVIYVCVFAAILGSFFCEFCVNVSAPPNLARRRISS